MRLEFSERALADIAHIHTSGIARFGKTAADSYAHDLLDRLEALSTTPEMAPLRPELGEGYRIFVINGHIAIYRLAGQVIKIVRILHGRQDWQSSI